MLAVAPYAAAALAVGFGATSIARRCVRAKSVHSGSGSLDALEARLQGCAREDVVLLIDFDRTITDGTSAQCHDVIGATECMPLRIREGFAKMLDFSEPFPPELQGDMWWEAGNELLLSEAREVLTPALARELVKATPLFGTSTQPMRARPGAVALLMRAAELRIPTLVVSAGFTAIIEGFLEAHGIPTTHLEVCSNRLLFEPVSGHLRAIEPSPPITGLNKHHTYARNRCWFDDHAAAGRRQLLVVGDSLGDLRCAEGVPDSFVVSSVGIYNENDGRRTLGEYEAAFTSVISGTAASLDPLRRVIDGLT